MQNSKEKTIFNKGKPCTVFFYFEIKCKIKWTKLSFTKSINSYQNLHETQWN